MRKILYVTLILIFLSACSSNVVNNEVDITPESYTETVKEDEIPEESSTAEIVIKDYVPPTSKDFIETAEGRAVIRETFQGKECAYIKYDEMDMLIFSPLVSEDYGIDTFQRHPQDLGMEVVDGIVIVNPLANIYLEKNKLIIQKEDSISILDLRGLLEGKIANAGTYTPDPDLEENRFERYIRPEELAFYQSKKNITLFIKDIDVMGQTGSSYILRIDLESLKIENIIHYYELNIADIIEEKNNFYFLLTNGQIPEIYNLVVLEKNTFEEYLSEENMVSDVINPYEYKFGETLAIEDDKLYITNYFSETEREMALDITEFK